MATDTDRLSARLRPHRSFAFQIPPLVGRGLWTVWAKLVSQGAQLATFIIAAHVLTPAQFGFFAFSSAIATLLVMLAEGGWAEFVMKSTEKDKVLEQVKSISLASGLLVTTLGLGIALVLYDGFGKRWEASLLALFSCWILPAAMTTVYDGTIVHRGALHKQAAIRIVAECAGLVVAALGLWAGMNVFALVAGRLAMQLLILGGSVLAVGWLRPALPREPVLREVLQFSKHVLANRLILFLRSYSGTLAIGGFLGLAEAGYYRAAERIVAAFSELVGEPARMLAWVVFRHARDREGEQKAAEDTIRAAGATFVPVFLAIAAPIYLGLALVSGRFVEVVLGEAWEPAALVVGILAAKQLLLAPAFITEPLLSVRGALSKLAPLSFLNATVSVSLILALAPFGMVVVAVGQGFAAAFGLATSVWLQQRHGGLDWAQIARDSGFILAAIAAMTAAVIYVGQASALSELRPVLLFALQVGAGAFVYFTVLALSWRFAAAGVRERIR